MRFFSAGLLMLLLGLVSQPLFAQADVELAPYKINKIDHHLPKVVTDEYLSGIRLIGEALVKGCKASRADITNPLVRRQSQLRVSKSKTGCRFNYQREMLWQYQCLLSEGAAKRLGQELIKRSNSHDALGDLGEKEQEILFSARYCDITKLN
jgi:hypothetical protein